MKIFHLTYSLGIGGAEKFLVELANTQSVNNEVYIVTFDDGLNFNNHYEIDKGITFISLKKYHKRSPMNVLQYFKLISKEKPDVIHVHALLCMIYLFLCPIFYKRVKFVATVHSTLNKSYQAVFKIFNKISWLTNRWKIVCISSHIKGLFTESFPKLLFHAIDNGIIPPKTTPQLTETKQEIDLLLAQHRHKKIFVAIGNYTNNKRPWIAADVANYFKEDLILLMIGQDTSADQKNFNVIKTKNYSNVFQIGLRKNISDYLHLSDCLLMTSVVEGMPLVILEALSQKLPIISTKAGGIIDMIANNENGFLSEDFTLESMIGCVNVFLKLSDAEVKQIREKNYQLFLDKFTMQRCADDYRKIMEN